ncbi:MAG: hypothetical protein KKF44_11665 [Nanoarchaeota archaeon]|nr:hypothetical protein [Nanoarchaeota archaeon]
MNLFQLTYNAFEDAALNFVKAIPALMYAIVMVAVGYLVAKSISWLVRKLLRNIIKLDVFIEKKKMHQAMGEMKLSEIAAGFTFTWIFIVFIGHALSQADFGVVTELILKFVKWTPSLVMASLMVIFGFYFAEFISSRLRNLNHHLADSIAFFAKPIIVFFIMLISLEEIGFEVKYLIYACLIILAAIALGFSIAIGIIFGFGMKDEAPKLMQKFRKYWENNRKEN